MTIRNTPILALMLAASALVGCGGGGGSSTAPDTHSVSASAVTMGGTISASSPKVNDGASVTFTVTPDNGFEVTGVEGTGCTVEQVDGAYTVSKVTADCEVSASFALTSGATLVTLGYAVKALTFEWAPVSGATHYRLFENPDASGFTQVGTDVTTTSTTSAQLSVPLYAWGKASYLVEACNGPTDSDCITLQTLTPSLADGINTIGYLKAYNSGADDEFGAAIALSADGSTLAVGAYGEAGPDDTAAYTGAVYIFVQQDGTWVQQAGPLRASNAQAGDNFGGAVALSADGNILAVGATGEDGTSSLTDYGSGAVYVFRRTDGVWVETDYVTAVSAGVGTDASDNFGASVDLNNEGTVMAVGASGEDYRAGAAYVYLYNGDTKSWEEKAYIKPSNSERDDWFAFRLDLSGDGNTLAAGAWYEDGDVDSAGNPLGDDKNLAPDAGAVYVFVPGVNGWADWSQQAYLKAPNAQAGDLFGGVVALSEDGNTLAVGAGHEDSAYAGICTIGTAECTDAQADHASDTDFGAAYLFARDGSGWSAQTYIKASNAGAGDKFGRLSLALSGDGNTLVVGSDSEDGSAIGMGTGLEGDDLSTANAGAAYLYVRGSTGWVQQAYLKAVNPGTRDWFGVELALSGNGKTVAVGSNGEQSLASDICAFGNCSETVLNEDAAEWVGAVYLY